MTKPDGEKAFSLLEVVVAIGIIGLLVLPLADALTAGMAGVSSSRAVIEASTLLQRAVEETKQSDFAMVVSTGPTRYPDSDSPYCLQLQVNDRPDRWSTDGAAIKGVTLTILQDNGGSAGAQLVAAEILLYRYNGL